MNYVRKLKNITANVMAKLSKRLSNLRSNLYYSQPIYVPGYVYSPWRVRLLIIFILVLLALTIFGLLLQREKNTNEMKIVTSSDNQSTPVENIYPPNVDPEENNQPATDNTTYYDVSRVIDGDTIELVINGNPTKIRIIGVDTPETVDSRKTVQCFGTEASNYVKNLLNGKKVALEVDSSQGDTDRYNRLLRYVFLPGGIDVGKQIISEGYGHEYTFNIPYKYQSQYKQAQEQARNKNAGLWSPQTCNGNTV